MFRALMKRGLHTSEQGQALVLFAGGIIVFCGFVAMSVDVGRAYWAKTTMQAAVDAASLAGAQSMPSGSSTAGAEAETNFDTNAGFLYSQGQNVTRVVTFPNGDRAVRIQGDADIPTWFARIFGINEWHVTAAATAESQVLDIAVVIDISGSMCFDSFPPVLTGGNGFGGVVMSPGRATPPAGGFLQPRLAANIDATQTTIQLNSVGIFNSTTKATNEANFGFNFSAGQRYHNVSPGGSSYPGFPTATMGLIMIDGEVMRITAVNAAANTLTVERARVTRQTGANITTVAAAHAANAIVSANRQDSNYCDFGAINTATASTNGPAQPFDGAIANAKYFVSLFNPAYDKIGLATYSTTGTLRRGLSNSWATLDSDMDNIFFPAGSTNTAHGIGIGRQILDGPGKRSNSVRIIVLLTDGVPNKYCTNAAAYTTAAACSTNSDASPSSCPASSPSINQAVAQAAAARAADVIVYTIGLGMGVLPCVLDEIAAAGGGENYLAPTLAQLDDAFAAIAAKTHISLVD